MSNKQTVTAYYMVVDAQQLIAFAKKAFGAKVGKIVNLPGTEKITHAEMEIGSSTVYFADSSANGLCGPECHDKNEQPSVLQLWLSVDDAGKTYEDAVAAGATGIMPVADQGDAYVGGIVDPFGNLWWIHSNK